MYVLKIIVLYGMYFHLYSSLTFLLQQEDMRLKVVSSSTATSNSQYTDSLQRPSRRKARMRKVIMIIAGTAMNISGSLNLFRPYVQRKGFS